MQYNELTPKKLLRLFDELKKTNMEISDEDTSEHSDELEQWLNRSVQIEESECYKECVEEKQKVFLSVLSSHDSIRSILSAPNSDLGMICWIKDSAKEASQNAANKVQMDIAIVIYYSAIAYALLNLQNKISDLPYQDLTRSFKQLKGKQWISSDLSELLISAEKYCKIRSSN